MKKDLGGSFSLVKILEGDHGGGFGRHYFLVKILGEIVGVSFVDLCLEGSTKTICYAMYLER